MRLRIPILKSVRTLARIGILAGIVPGLCACYDSGFGNPEPENQTLPVTISIAQLKRQFTGKPFTLGDDFSITGTVTSSDKAGNFYRTICIEQERAAIELMAGIDQLHNIFPVGCSVTLHLDGLTVARRLGVIQIGNSPEPGSGYDTDYIGSRAALEKIIIRNSGLLCETVPARLSIPELSAEFCGTLVRIDNLQYSPEEPEESSEPGVWNGYRRFLDPDGLAIYSYVRSYADFASEPVPQGRVALIGILQREESAAGRYLIKLRDENDCVSR